jgi:hypothetical protein
MAGQLHRPFRLACFMSYLALVEPRYHLPAFKSRSKILARQACYPKPPSILHFELGGKVHRDLAVLVDCPADLRDQMPKP